MKIRNQAGFSLVQVLIAAGLVGVVSLGVAQLMVDSSRIAKSNQSKIDQVVTVSSISNVLLTEKKCTEAMKNQPYVHANASTSNGQEIQLKMPDGTIYKKGNPIPGSNLEFHSLKIKNSSDETDPPSSPTKVYNVQMTAQLKGTSALVGGQLYNEKDIANFFITVDPAKQIQSCSSQLGLYYLCNKMKGQYNKSTHECDVKPTTKEACDILKGIYDKATDTCSQFKYKNCGALKHGQTTIIGGKKSCGKWSKTTKICLDGSLVTSSYESGHAGSCHSCFIGKTLVRMHDGSEKRIDQIQVGDRVLGENGMINTVEEIETPDLGNRELFSLNNDGNYFVTAEHPFRSTRGWVSLSPEDTAHEHNFLVLQEPMTEGDYLYKYNSVPLRLDDIDSKPDDPKTRVYNLLLDGNNTYYANDYLVHNKDVK